MGENCLLSFLALSHKKESEDFRLRKPQDSYTKKGKRACSYTFLAGANHIFLKESVFFNFTL